MGVTTLTEEDNSLPLALGGLEKELVLCKWQELIVRLLMMEYI